MSFSHKKARQARQEPESPESDQMEYVETAVSSGTGPAATVPADVLKDEQELPNRILYITNLPPDVTDEMLSVLFQQYV
jgi:RNA recognition motif-containing protein